MRRVLNLCRRGVGPLAAVFLSVSSCLTAPAWAQLTVLEPGFTVTTLPPSVGSKQLECSPGGVWGPYVYVADSGGNLIERIDPANIVSVFAAPGNFPVGLAFGPGPASNFGTFLYVVNFVDENIVKIDPSGTVSFFTAITKPGSNTFDPSGVYGTDMFATTAFNGPIWEVDNAGSLSVFSTLAATYIKFGPGGAWGTGMYSTSHTATPGFGIAKVDAGGNATLFVGGYTTPEGFDWATGPLFGGDMFSCDVGTGEIWRVKPTGTRTLWATLPSAADVAFCNGALYVVSAQGGCYCVSDLTVPVFFAGLSALAAGRSVELRWELSADEPIEGFRIYRREDGESNEVAIAGGALLPGDARQFVDVGVTSGKSYVYAVGAVVRDGEEIRSMAARVAIDAGSLALSQNQPNPFNPATTIEYTIVEGARVSLSVYDANGNFVVALEAGDRPAGTHTAVWDGRDANGRPAATGVYFYRLKTGSRVLTKKMVLLK